MMIQTKSSSFGLSEFGRIRILGAVVLALHAASLGRAHDVAVPVRVVSYNVHLLPEVAAHVAGKCGASGYRATAIGARLAPFDLIGISEAFDHDHTLALLNSLQTSSEVPLAIAWGPQRSGRHLIGSGLVLVSRWPIEQTHTITYSHASRFINSGFKADGFAAKGALHARLRIGEDPDARLDCFLTHLESRSEDARAKQIQELSAFIAQHASRDIPLIAMGDFNVEALEGEAQQYVSRDTPYHRLRRTLVYQGRSLLDVETIRQYGPAGTSDAVARDGGRRIDYIFFSLPKGTGRSQLTPLSAATLPMLDERVPEGALSDHVAVTCDARFSWRTRPSNHRTRVR